MGGSGSKKSEAFEACASRLAQNEREALVAWLDIHGAVVKGVGRCVDQVEFCTALVDAGLPQDMAEALFLAVLHEDGSAPGQNLIHEDKLAAMVVSLLVGRGRECGDVALHCLGLAGGPGSDDAATVETAAVLDGLTKVLEVVVASADADGGGAAAEATSLRVFATALFAGSLRGEVQAGGGFANDVFDDGGNLTDEVTMGDVAEFLSDLRPVTDVFASIARAAFLSPPSSSSDSAGGPSLRRRALKVLPELTSALGDTTLLRTEYVWFLAPYLPSACRVRWEKAYCSLVDGTSFNRFLHTCTGAGPLLIFVRDVSGAVFGGFVSEALKLSSEWEGSAKNFLFSLAPVAHVYRSTGYNDHYQYCNDLTMTFPNGFGMGGLHNHYGLWLDSSFDWGMSKGAPCSTYGSPPLGGGDERFEFAHVEVWVVRREETDDDAGPSILDKDKDAQMLLKLAGRTQHSDGLRDEP